MSEWLFWITAGAMTLGIGGMLVAAMLRGRTTEGPAAFDVQVYRDQLAEVERDLARGVIDSGEAGRLRTEVSRRLLEADRLLRGEKAGGQRGSMAVAALIALVIAAAPLVYLRLGAPGYPDMPLETRLSDADARMKDRPSQAEAEAGVAEATVPQDADPQFMDLMEKLRLTVANRPDDLRGQELLARNEARLGRYRAAAAAQTQVVALKGDQAQAEDHAGLAELLILAAGGYVSPEAEAALTEALRRDARNGTARYYSGLMFAQGGRPDRAFLLWRDLFETSPPDAPWMAVLSEQLPQIAELAGVRYRLPEATAPGPTGADMAAAAEMSGADRQAMIEGMVEQLSSRLDTQGGSAEEWTQLVTSLAVLGRMDEARAALVKAEAALADDAAGLDALRAAATGAGVTP